MLNSANMVFMPVRNHNANNLVTSVVITHK